MLCHGCQHSRTSSVTGTIGLKPHSELLSPFGSSLALSSVFVCRRWAFYELISNAQDVVVCGILFERWIRLVFHQPRTAPRFESASCSQDYLERCRLFRTSLPILYMWAFLKGWLSPSCSLLCNLPCLILQYLRSESACRFKRSQYEDNFVSCRQLGQLLQRNLGSDN